ncbi:hypothetical protein [Gemmatimonas sp.]|uniref:hypothetical protein n=1 Tax=Gemmatimonas sp. TaxID=1962908 RepID=UPI0025BA5165|nr:hypothetical protein [Gemmatimonas sp.]MCA2990796.1 hypothetical protein [Gemmatimonas sp.]
MTPDELDRLAALGKHIVLRTGDDEMAVVPALVAEVRRLRALVEAAYREAHAELHPLGDSKANPRYWEPSALVDYKRDEDRGWEVSFASKALDASGNAPAPTEGSGAA